MLASVTLFAALLLSGLMVPNPTGDASMLAVLGMVAGTTALFSVWGASLTMPKAPAQTVWIMRFAGAESVALFGLVAHMVGAPAGVTAGFFVLAYVLLILARPTADAITAWEMRRLS